MQKVYSGGVCLAASPVPLEQDVAYPVSHVKREVARLAAPAHARVLERKAKNYSQSCQTGQRQKVIPLHRGRYQAEGVDVRRAHEDFDASNELDV